MVLVKLIDTGFKDIKNYLPKYENIYHVNIKFEL